MLPAHEDTDPPGMIPMHYTWGEPLEDYNAGKWVPQGTMIWYFQKCFKYARDNEEATVKFEDFMKALKESGDDRGVGPESEVLRSRWGPRAPTKPDSEVPRSSWEPRASTPAPSGRRVPVKSNGQDSDPQDRRDPLEQAQLDSALIESRLDQDGDYGQGNQAPWWGRTKEEVGYNF